MATRTVAKGWMAVAAVLGWPVVTATAGPPQPATAAGDAEMIASPGKDEDYGNAALVYVLDEAGVYMEASGRATTENRELIKVLTDGGTRAQSVLRQELDLATSRVIIKAVPIRRHEGGIEDTPVSGAVTQPATQHAIYWGSQQYRPDLPRLEVGDRVEVRISQIGYHIACLADDREGASGGGGETLQPPVPGHWYGVTREEAYAEGTLAESRSAVRMGVHGDSVNPYRIM